MSLGEMDMKTRFIPNQIHLTSTTFRTRRSKSLDQQTLLIENVPGRAPRDVPDRATVHPPRKPSTTYQVINAPPDRVYGQVSRTKFGGEATTQDANQTWWERGEHWNRDSNIKRWNFQEVRRNAAQVKICCSDENDFLMLCTCRAGKMIFPARLDEGTKILVGFSSIVSFFSIRNIRMQGSHDVHRHEQINHERLAADRENPVDMFKTWIPPRKYDKYNPKPGAARDSCGIHNQLARKNTEYGWCYDGDSTRPSAIYTKKFQKMGEDAFRKRGTWVI
ncbi:unnamed protein product [Amoebophrya sp. A120]|nr:unnamed protein product [Amoebophrya sp. A120]|eukprot:GSA120T00012347001.1